ncbi:hypothetical protein STSP2_02364 [Anaerohalosphaera lusitana]|uniref:Uncharacterized protein n=2 Tax=Anaerohalosphaera lusitana TaxID=1936003 RepID=A0A1U9NN00_9BACT|nr:hypothetical protein STSP2_02364 [Anaerohalosphaera lusitana]
MDKKLYYFVAVVLMNAGVVFSAPAGLVNHWNFDEGPDWHNDIFNTVCQETVARDSVSAADLTMQNMDSADWVSGVQFTCLEFDGVDDYLLGAADLSDPLGSTMSMAYWVRTTQSSSPGVSGSGQIQLGSVSSSGMVEVWIDGSVAISSTDQVNDGSWHHVAITRDAATGEIHIYVDGKLSNSTTGPMGDRTAAFSSIGYVAGTGGGSGYFNGRLDQIHIFNTVVDAATVQTLMDNHAPKVGSSSTQGTYAAAFTTASIFLDMRTYDPEQNSLSVFSFAQPAHGTVVYNSNGTFDYTADAGFTGVDSFEVVVEDGKGGFAATTVWVQVLDAPSPDSARRTTTFTDFQAVQAGGSDITLGSTNTGMRVPRAVDWDGDGDNDLLVGQGGFVWLYMNTGSLTSPMFAAGVKVQANGHDISLSGDTAIAFADMTGDGVDDLLVLASGDLKMRIYPNTSLVGQVPIYAAATIVKNSSGNDFIFPDKRFDIVDWDGDSLLDIVTGTYNDEVRVYYNVNTAADPRYNESNYDMIREDLNNVYPRAFDVNRDGAFDLVTCNSFGSNYWWIDPAFGFRYEASNSNGLDDRYKVYRRPTLEIADAFGEPLNIQPYTNGAIVDFADFNSDGVYDLLIGGHWDPHVYIAYGTVKTVADYIADIEAIYDAYPYPANLGAALEANDQALLNEIKAAEIGIIDRMLLAPESERQAMFDQMVSHVQKYAFLQMGSIVDTSLYHHLPSIAGQNLMTMHQMLPDTPAQRVNVANAVGLTGLHREIYLASGLHLADNQHALQGMLESVLDFMKYHPRVLFPDTSISLDLYWLDENSPVYAEGRDGWVDVFTGAKNTFGTSIGVDVTNWWPDIEEPIQHVLGTNAQMGDRFTFVMAHEVTHSLSGYMNMMNNRDLRRRWGQALTLAAGPDIISFDDPGGYQDDWIDWAATKAHFQDQEYWDGDTASWSDAWDAYWTSGPGSAWRYFSIIRGDISANLTMPQESLATIGNNDWANTEGLLIGAVDRWRRGVESGIEPIKICPTHVLRYLDFKSAGLNKMVMYDTHGIQSPYPQATYDIYPAWLQRDDKGFITKVTVNGHVYDFVLDANGIVTDVSTNIDMIYDDSVTVYKDVNNSVDVLGNDFALEGGVSLTIDAFTQPSHGTVCKNGDNTLSYLPNPGYTGNDSFTYAAGRDSKNSTEATVTLEVLNSIQDDLVTHLTMDDADISGTTIEDVSGSPIYDGTNSGAVTGTSGQIDQAMTFDVNDYVSVPTMNLNTNTFTISAWIKPGQTQADWCAILSCRSTSTNFGLHLLSTRELRYNWNNETYGWSSGLIVPADQWSHVALVVTPTAATIYLNETSATFEYTHSAEEFDAQMKIGVDNGHYYAGEFDDLAIWDRALSGNEINYIYQQGLSGRTFSSEPVFSADPFFGPDALEGGDYVGSISTVAVDPDDDAISYSKVDGPGWLQIKPDGSLSGRPRQADVNATAEFAVRAADEAGNSVLANLNITVLDTYSGELGLADLVGFAAHWLDSGCLDLPPCDGADLSGNGDVNVDDFGIFSTNWLAKCVPVSCHVNSIVPSTVNGTYGRIKYSVAVTVQDNCGNSVAGATVSGTFTGAFTEQVTGTTDASGVAVLTTAGQVTSPSFTICIDEVSHAELDYEPNGNIETCDSY